MNTDIINRYTALGGITLLTTIANAIWFLINFKSKKAIATSKATLSKEEAQSSIIDNDIKRNNNAMETINWTAQKLKELEYREEKSHEKMDKQQKYIIMLIRLINNNDPFYCSNIQCKEREPRWGLHKTKLPTLSEFLKEEDVDGTVE